MHDAADFLTPQENALLAVSQDPWLIERRAAAWRETNRIWRAIMIAGDLEVCEALLNNELVPVDRLDPVWAARFGFRNQEAA